MTPQELWKLAAALARETATKFDERGRPHVTTGDIVTAAYQLGLDAGRYQAR